MKYLLQPRLLSPPPALEIAQDEYQGLCAAKPVLIAAFELEENFDLLIGNYLELETSVLAIATESLARRRHAYHELFEVRSEVNRRAVNFLSTARLFVDQILQKVRQCGVDSISVKTALSSHFDSNFEYRFMEALRNHVQHSGSAVHTLGIGSRWLPPTEHLRNEYSTTLITLRRFLEQDRTFKATTLAECSEEIEFMPAARKYLECLGSAHETSRTLIKENVDSARQRYQTAVDKYKAFSNESALGLAAFASPGTEATEVVSVFLDWDDVRLQLVARNSSLVNLSKRYVSSATHDA